MSNATLPATLDARSTGLTTLLNALKPFADSVLATVLGFGIGAILLLLWGFDPLKTYAALLSGAFGSPQSWARGDFYDLAQTLSAATPLVLTGLTFAIGMRAGLFNIGSQGQLILGGIAAVTVSRLQLPPGLHLLVAIVMAMAVGALWSLPAAILKLTRGVHEVITTIMLNWIAVWLGLYLTASQLVVDPNRAEKTISAAPGSRFPLITLLFGTGHDLTYALFASILFALITYWVLWQMSAGYELRSAGLNSEAARYGGISQWRSLGLAFVLGGLASGLAGATQVLGRPPSYSIYTDLSTFANLGFDGLTVGLIGKNHPIGVIFAAIFFGALSTGARLMQIQASVPLEMVRVVQGIIIVAVAIPGLWRVFRIFRARSRRGGVVEPSSSS
jgi:simple sugar transport system permease protein